MKLIKSLILVLSLVYLSAVAINSVRYKSLILDPRVLKSETEMYLVALRSKKDGPAQGEEDGPLSPKNILQKVSSMEKLKHRELVDIELNQHLKETEMLIVDMDSRLQPAKTINPKHSVLSTAKPIDIAASEVGQRDNLVDDAALAELDFLAADPESLPSEADINTLISRQSSGASTTNEIPPKVLTRVEETTGISSQEIKDLLEQEPQNNQ